METTFDQLIKKVANGFNKPLPGVISQNKMAARSNLKLPETFNKSTKKSAVLILLYPDENSIKIPFILRPAYDGMHGGQVAFPGGRMELTDENLFRTALREAQEEVGIRIADVNLIGSLTELYIPISNYLVLPVVGWMNKKPDFYPDPIEVDSILEIKYSTLVNPAIVKEEILMVRGNEIQAPLFDVGEHKIWGATAMMIAEFLDLINKN